jgi:phage tail sheath protein FI
VNGQPVAGATLATNNTTRITTATVSPAPANLARITADYVVINNFTPVAAGEVRLCTNFSEYKNFFGDFSTDVNHRNLTHAVFGFFNNGGSRCYVARVTAVTGIQAVLTKFEAIDEIAIVAAPGITDNSVRGLLDIHARQTTQDRFAIFDSPEVVETSGNLDTTLLSIGGSLLPQNSDFVAFYFPWLRVFDPATQIQSPTGTGLQFVPPSGHIAGIYARVDTQRGVHKAPANEPVLGALGLKYGISKAQQEGLNPQGVNCIRDLNGNIRVWGARTMGGEANADLKYINVRRTLLFLRESIDEGMQFVVFEPNTPALWQKIVRNVSAFLTNVWRSGALFGTTVQEAYFVKCDAELNPPEVRELGQVITEIGVAIVRPAEFVIFRISQFTAPA